MQVTYLMLVYSVFKVREGRSNKSLYLTTPPQQASKTTNIYENSPKNFIMRKNEQKKSRTIRYAHEFGCRRKGCFSVSNMF